MVSTLATYAGDPGSIPGVSLFFDGPSKVCAPTPAQKPWLEDLGRKRGVKIISFATLPLWLQLNTREEW